MCLWQQDNNKAMYSSNVYIQCNFTKFTTPLSNFGQIQIAAFIQAITSVICSVRKLKTAENRKGDHSEARHHDVSEPRMVVMTLTSLANCNNALIPGAFDTNPHPINRFHGNSDLHGTRPHDLPPVRREWQPFSPPGRDSAVKELVFLWISQLETICIADQIWKTNFHDPRSFQFCSNDKKCKTIKFPPQKVSFPQHGDKAFTFLARQWCSPFPFFPPSFPQKIFLSAIYPRSSWWVHQGPLGSTRDH